MAERKEADRERQRERARERERERKRDSLMQKEKPIQLNRRLPRSCKV